MRRTEEQALRRYSLLGGLVAAAILAVALLGGAGAADSKPTVQSVQAGNPPCSDCW
jgi:hypothetical protein